MKEKGKRGMNHAIQSMDEDGEIATAKLRQTDRARAYRGLVCDVLLTGPGQTVHSSLS